MTRTTYDNWLLEAVQTFGVAARDLVAGLELDLEYSRKDLRTQMILLREQLDRSIEDLETERCPTDADLVRSSNVNALIAQVNAQTKSLRQVNIMIERLPAFTS